MGRGLGGSLGQVFAAGDQVADHRPADRRDVEPLGPVQPQDPVLQAPVFPAGQVVDHDVAQRGAINQRSHRFQHPLVGHLLGSIRPDEPQRLHGGVGFVERGLRVGDLGLFQEIDPRLTRQVQVASHRTLDANPHFVGRGLDELLQKLPVTGVPRQPQHHPVETTPGGGHPLVGQPLPQLQPIEPPLGFLHILELRPGELAERILGDRLGGMLQVPGIELEALGGRGVSRGRTLQVLHRFGRARRAEDPVELARGGRGEPQLERPLRPRPDDGNGDLRFFLRALPVVLEQLEHFEGGAPRVIPLGRCRLLPTHHSHHLGQRVLLSQRRPLLRAEGTRQGHADRAWGQQQQRHQQARHPP